MSKIDCGACDDLRNDAPEFVQNGVNSKICTSLKNDTGLNPNLSVTHTDCEDLDTANDCLIGRMDSELETYDVCDWKKFMHKFIPNLRELLKAMICAICGIWTNIHDLWEKVNKHDCEINYLMEGASFRVGEDTDGDAYAVAGKGVSFLIPHEGSEHTADISLTYIAGGLIRGSGSFQFFNDDFDDEDAVGNFDLGSTYRKTTHRKGNSVWGTTGARMEELICEFRIKRSAFPQIKTFYGGFGIEASGGSYHVRLLIFNGGSYAYGQHGMCDSDGSPHSSGDDSGHLVPDGWTYIQMRMSYADLFHINATTGSQYSPHYFMGIRMEKDKIPC